MGTGRTKVTGGFDLVNSQFYMLSGHPSPFFLYRRLATPPPLPRCVSTKWKTPPPPPVKAVLLPLVEIRPYRDLGLKGHNTQHKIN